MADGRMRRVDEAVREVLSDAISKDLKDPRIGFVTVTAVNTSRDLRHARVYVSVLGDERARRATLEGLRSAHGYLQGVIASQLSLKHTPSLTTGAVRPARRRCTSCARRRSCSWSPTRTRTATPSARFWPCGRSCGCWASGRTRSSTP